MKAGIAQVNLTIFDQGAQIDREAVRIDAASIYRAFEQVKDGRKSKGKRYPLALLLTLILLGKMAGETKIEGIIDWIAERKREIKKLLNWPKDFPVEKTYTDALAKCDHHEIAQAIAQVLVKSRAVKQCGNEPSRLVAQKEPGEEHLIQTAVDGKILRGTLKHEREDQPPVHLLSFYESLYECRMYVIPFIIACNSFKLDNLINKFYSILTIFRLMLTITGIILVRYHSCN